MDTWTLHPQFSDFRAVDVDIKVTLVVGKIDGLSTPNMRKGPSHPRAKSGEQTKGSRSI